MLKTFSGRNASQNEYELRNFIDFLVKNNVKRYLEIGSRHGDTFHEVMRHLPVGSFGCAVDLPGGLWGKKNTEESLALACNDLSDKGYSIMTILGDSSSREIVEAVKVLGDFDAILIDGDHTYTGAKKDWLNYKDLAKYVAFHDIVGTGQKEKVSNRKVEVPILWAELKSQLEFTVEYINSGSTMGIGVCILR